MKWKQENIFLLISSIEQPKLYFNIIFFNMEGKHYSKDQINSGTWTKKFREIGLHNIAPLVRPVQVTPRKSFLLSDNPVWLAPRDCQPTDSVRHSRNYFRSLEKCKFPVGLVLTVSFKDPFDRRFFYLLAFVFLYPRVQTLICFHVDADCSQNF